jgi:hypothetical protein
MKLHRHTLTNFELFVFICKLSDKKKLFDFIIKQTHDKCWENAIDAVSSHQLSDIFAFLHIWNETENKYKYKQKHRSEWKKSTET